MTKQAQMKAQLSLIAQLSIQSEHKTCQLEDWIRLNFRNEGQLHHIGLIMTFDRAIPDQYHASSKQDGTSMFKPTN